MRKRRKHYRKVRNCVDGPNFSGQHLLHSKKVIYELIETAGVRPGDTVVEIGAGKGAITFALAEKANKVLAVEYDKRFAAFLKKRVMSYPNLSIIQQDFLRFHLPNHPFTVAASIPYAITTPIMRKLLDHPSGTFEGGALVMEHGAAKRFTSNPTSDPVVLKWRMYYDLKYVEKIARKHFFPVPGVDSAILRIRRKAPSLIPYKYGHRFLGLAEYALRFPRLAVRDALKGVLTVPQIHRLLRTIGVDQHAAICTLSDAQWGTVFNTMIRFVPSSRWPAVKRKKR